MTTTPPAPQPLSCRDMVELLTAYRDGALREWLFAQRKER